MLCNICDVVSVARPHSHVVSPLKYPHFFLCSLLQVYPVLSLFRHLQLSQGLSCPVVRSSYRLTKPVCAFSSGCCCLPTPMALASGGSPMFPLVVHQPASPSIWPAVQSLQRGLSRGDNVVRMWVQLKR